ncbi:hypothetical protein EsH8_II_000507 [Colletotrichum jinshuiense]
MPATLSILYPNEADAKYDIDYYQNSHMPSVGAQWKSAGATSWNVTKYVTGSNDKQPKYAFAGIFTFDSIEGIHKALAFPETAAFMDDVPNYSNKEPVFLFGEVSKETNL